MKTNDTLLAHVLILDRIAHRRTVLTEESLGVDKRVLPFETPADLAKRTYRTLLRDAHHLGGDLFVEVAFACECGSRLEQGPPLLAWAHHAAAVTGHDEAVLVRHAVSSLRGSPATATCDCGRAFKAISDPHDPSEALGKWAAHVAGAAG